MDTPDAAVGKVVLGVTSTVFALLVLWVNTHPFIDEDLDIYSLIPNPQWFLLLCALWGLLFIGGLMSFTVYHMYWDPQLTASR